MATILLVLLTLFGAVPIYRRVARSSPHGQGSIAMLQRLLRGGSGKFMVLTMLGFAGASAMSGLLNLIPRYLPRFGMAPDWVSSTCPLVGVIIGVSCVVTLLFQANVEDQGDEMPVVFVEVSLGDTSDFFQEPMLDICHEGGHYVIKVSHCTAIAPAIAALALSLNGESNPIELHFLGGLTKVRSK